MTTDLLQSAIDAIELGVEDFESRDPRRAGAAVRNFYAGVLLMLKERLRRESPALLHERVRPRRGPQGLSWEGEGTAVSVETIMSHFKALGWRMDWTPLQALRRLRNDIEHGGARHSESVLRMAISQTFVLVAVLLTRHLDEVPGRLLDGRAWACMHAESDTYRTMRQDCIASLKRVPGIPKSIAGPAREAMELSHCSSCGSDLLRARGEDEYPETDVECVSCGKETTARELILSVVGDEITSEAYAAAHDGPWEIHGTCPNCGEDAFNMELDACLLCAEGRLYLECDRCAEPLGLDEQETGLCSYCQHMSDKMMRE